MMRTWHNAELVRVVISPRDESPPPIPDVGHTRKGDLLLATIYAGLKRAGA
jgi:hypothetical protein